MCLYVILSLLCSVERSSSVLETWHLSSQQLFWRLLPPTFRLSVSPSLFFVYSETMYCSVKGIVWSTRTRWNYLNLGENWQLTLLCSRRFVPQLWPNIHVYSCCRGYASLMPMFIVIRIRTPWSGFWTKCWRHDWEYACSVNTTWLFMKIRWLFDWFNL